MLPTRPSQIFEGNCISLPFVSQTQRFVGCAVACKTFPPAEDMQSCIGINEYHRTHIHIHIHMQAICETHLLSSSIDVISELRLWFVSGDDTSSLHWLIEIENWDVWNQHHRHQSSMTHLNFNVCTPFAASDLV